MKSQSPFVALMVVIGTAGSHARAQTPTKEASILTQPAQVEPYEQANIVAKASGFVKAVHVDIGDTVKQGALLAELSIPEMEQERLQQEALVEQAEAGIRQAEAAVTSAGARIAHAIAVGRRESAPPTIFGRHPICPKRVPPY